MKFHVQYAVHSDRTEIYGISRDGAFVDVAMPIEIRRYTSEEYDALSGIEPCICLQGRDKYLGENSSGQTLINGLWDVGLRPVGHASSKDTVYALQNHIDDLRQIAFKALKI